MSKPCINRTEAAAAIDRAVEVLKTLKGQLRAKTLSGSALDKLLGIAMEELRALQGPFNEQYHRDLDIMLQNLAQMQAERDDL